MSFATEMERKIQRGLQNLDRDLFLDKEWSALGYVYYVVRYNIGSGRLPLTVMEIRDGMGPLPLSMDILDTIARNEGDITDAIAQVTANNAAKKELMRQEREAAQEEIAREMQRSAKRLGMSGPWKPKFDVWAYDKTHSVQREEEMRRKKSTT